MSVLPIISVIGVGLIALVIYLIIDKRKSNANRSYPPENDILKIPSRGQTK